MDNYLHGIGCLRSYPCGTRLLSPMRWNVGTHENKQPTPAGVDGDIGAFTPLPG